MELRLSLYHFIQNNSPTTIDYIKKIENSFYSGSIGERVALLFIPLPCLYDTLKQSALATKYWVRLNFKEAFSETTKVAKTAALVVFLVFSTPINLFFPNSLWKAPQPVQTPLNPLTNEDFIPEEFDSLTLEVNDVLKTMIQILKEPSDSTRDLDFMLNLSINDKINVNRIISRLNAIFSYNNYQFHKKFVFKFICEFFSAFENNERLKSRALASIETYINASIRTSKDQTPKLLIYLFCLHKIEGELRGKSFPILLNFLVRAFKTYTLDSVVKEDINHEFLEEREELQLVLYTQLQLAESLDLLLLVDNVSDNEYVFNESTSLIDLNHIKKEVNESYVDSLFECDLFQELLNQDPIKKRMLDEKMSFHQNEINILEEKYNELKNQYDSMVRSEKIAIEQKYRRSYEELLEQKRIFPVETQTSFLRMASEAGFCKEDIRALQRKIRREWIEDILRESIN